MSSPGFWESPITPELLVSGAVGINEVVADGDDVYWAESRPDEGGRAVIVRWRGGQITEVTGPEVNVRTRVHEYGGGAWWVADGTLVYSDDARGGELFALEVASGEERRLTSSGHRYADGRTTTDGEQFVCVREVHRGIEATEVDNQIVAVSLADGSEAVLARGHDFYSSPRIGPDGRIAFIAWDHPNMPWDTTLLYVGALSGEGTDAVGEFRRVPTAEESVVLPGWTSDGRLLAVTDRSDWWNLVEIDPQTGEQLTLVGGQIEVATPGWVFGLSRWCETDAGVVAVATSPDGDTIRFPSGSVERRHTSVNSIRALDDGRVAYTAASFAEEPAVWIHDGSDAVRISRPRDLGLDPAYFPRPEHLTFDVTAVDPSAPPGTVASALFYAPASPVGPGDDGTGGGTPPLLVMVHGGPTAAARRQLNLAIRFWTSRGVAVADVDYRGSTGYGRDYRNQLRGGFGVVDVVDCVAAAKHLADTGRVDPTRMVISGGSSGGLAVYNALARHDVFTGGMSRYGVADLTALATDTHKFEARYLDSLIGPWPEDRATYVERSPLTHVDSIDAPMLVLQGADDKVVPPSQSRRIVEALEAKGTPVTYIEFPGEGHGFRRGETQVAVLEAELAFIGSL